VIKQLGKGLAQEEVVDQFLLSADRSLALRYEFIQYYLPGEPVIDLLAVLFKDEAGTRLLLTDKLVDAEHFLYVLPEPLTPDAFNELSTRLAAPLFNLDGPLLLEPISIAKPWGQEIWYTGIEERGQSGFSDGTHSAPIPWLLSLIPHRLLGAGQPSLNLLKILDPLAEPVYGDLYFELHEKKREVYVVTHVDRQSWPDGEGAIRFGFDKHVRDEFSSPDTFRLAYLQAVRDYERVRRAIDQYFDQQRIDHGIALNQALDSRLLKQWHKGLPPNLQEEEAALRKAMNRFTHMRALKEGDVVKVPCLLPHALQHGVRTVEFQTPVYERKILAFGQKVLTQDNWDTEEAVALMSLQSEAEEQLAVLEQGQGFCCEQVVAFDDFQVQRITLLPGVSWQIYPSDNYKLLMVVAGDIALDSDATTLSAEEAVFLPALGTATAIRNSGQGDGIVLLSRPLTSG